MNFSLLTFLAGLTLILSLLFGMERLPAKDSFSIYQQRAIAISQNQPGTLNLVQQGREFYETGQFSQAAATWQQAAVNFRADGDVLNLAMVLSNLALAYQQIGQLPQAKAAIAYSLKLLQTEQDAGRSTKQLWQILSQALNTQGTLQLALGEAEQALTIWKQATATYAKAGDDIGITRSSINQSLALQSLGLYRRALETLKQVNKTLQTQPSSHIKVAGLLSLGNALRVVGDLDESRQILQQSLAIAQELKSPPDIGSALLSLGNTVRSQQDIQAALTYYQQAAIASVSPTAKIQAQLNQLRLLLETKQWSTAKTLSSQLQTQIATLPLNQTAIYARIDLAQSIANLQKNTYTTSSGTENAKLLATAVQQARSLGNRRAEAYALGYLGRLYEQTQQLSNAQDLTQQALLIAQSINALDISYRWQWQLGRLLKARGDIVGAIAAYDEAVKTLQILRNDLVAINPDIQFSFREEVEPVYRQLVDLLLASGREGERGRGGEGEQGKFPNPKSKTQNLKLGSSQSPVSQKNLLKARQIIESLQLAELNNFLRAACLDTKQQIDEVIDREDPTAAIVYPIILADRLEVILKLPQQELHHHSIPIFQKKVETTLEQLRQQLIEPDMLEEFKVLSHQVYDWLIQPVEALAKSNVKTLVFVLDGSLKNIPMAALYDGQQYLINKYAIALTPSLQLIDPKPLKQEQLKAVVAGLTETRLGFSALPNVKNELEEIQSAIVSRVLLNEQFTTDALQNQVDSLPFPVVHLATHGQFSSNPDETFIVAWDKRMKVNELNNFLQTRNQSQSSALQLLVLSACQTAAGDKRAALGIAGVAVRAGARSTLASLWNVNDKSTALLMSQFYQELAKNQLSKAEALRQAQLVLMKMPKYQHPLFWAAYILVGNWL